jgi:hypothetical protein
MKISFSRYIVDTMRICDFTEDEHRMLTCRYEFLGENGLIGQLEYFGELAYFTIDNNTFKIETGFDFSYLIPFTRSFLKESKSGKKIGSFSNFGKGFTYNKRFENPSEILTLKQTAPTYKSRQGLNDNSPRNYVFSK